MNTITTGCLIVGLLLSLCAGAAPPAPLKVVAAENFYGGVVRQIGGDRVAVTDILNDPDQDPHLFEAAPSVARALAQAALVVYNGAGYDSWFAKLLGGGSATRRVINVAELTGVEPGANPHIWYDPRTMIRLARELAASFRTRDPDHAGDYDRRLQGFVKDMGTLEKQIHAMRASYQGAPITATEPVFGYMARALGLKMRNVGFQMAIMNGTEPSASQVAAFEDDLRNREVRAVIYNVQAAYGTTARLRELAGSMSIPVVGVTELQPQGKTYVEWMLGQLNSLARALQSADQ
ncbi:MAG: zinc ABC transporter substrate-binding protein [Arenicellales bacterium]